MGGKTALQPSETERETRHFSAKEKAMRNKNLLLLPSEDQEELALQLIQDIGARGVDLVRSIHVGTIKPAKMAAILDLTVRELELLFQYLRRRGTPWTGFTDEQLGDSLYGGRN